MKDSAPASQAIPPHAPASADASMHSPPLPQRAWIGLGSNLPSGLGDSAQTLAAARTRIAALPGTRLEVSSSLYHSPPFEAQGPDFLNQVVRVHTTLPATQLLQALLAIETAAGRERPYRNAPRTLDLDLLLYGTDSSDSTFLTLPHPRMAQRLFVLMPLVEIDPDVPVGQRGSARQLLAQLRQADPAQVCTRLAEGPGPQTSR